MASTDASFGGLVVPPKVPVFTDDISIEEYLKDIEKHLKKVSGVISEVGLAIETSYSVDESRIINLTVSNIWANNIITEDLSVGAEESIKLRGTLNQIQIFDKQTTPQLRGLFGKLGLTNSVLKFDGISTKIDCGNPAKFAENTIIVEAQFKLETLPTVHGAAMNIFNKGNKFLLWVANADNTLRLWDFNASTTRNSGKVITVDRWYHVALIYVSGSSTNNELWLDGEKIFDNFLLTSVDNNFNFFIGAKSGTSEFMKGWIREVRWWSYSAQPIDSDIKSLNVQNLPASVRPTNLGTFRAYYRIDEGTGTTANDNGDDTASDGTITDETWETIDDNYGLRLMNKDGGVEVNLGDTIYIDGFCLINNSVRGESIVSLEFDKVDNVLITDSLIVNVEFSKIDNVLVTDSQIVNIEYSKIDNVLVTNTDIVSIAYSKVTSVAVTNADIVSINYSKITNVVVTESDIGVLAVTNSKIGLLAITNTEIDNVTIDTGKHVANSITDSTVVSGSTITWPISTAPVEKTLVSSSVATGGVDVIVLYSCDINPNNLTARSFILKYQKAGSTKKTLNLDITGSVTKSLTLVFTDTSTTGTHTLRLRGDISGGTFSAIESCTVTNHQVTFILLKT